ncbi:hypothetical protein ACFX5U_15100 [Sphingobacterium sp. SG20118]|uniref:hypothetical protein n=1 Tax=Sphingobacterium sp. SG20118 TaxID=3367156 RepID=UPI0037DFC3A3
MQLPNPYLLKNEDFMTLIQVICPKCKDKAVVLGGKPFRNIVEYESEVRFSCVTCGFALEFSNIPKFTLDAKSRKQDIQARVLMLNTSCDPFFGFDVWYRVDTMYGILCAYNLEHLNAIEYYISDMKRNRNGLPYKNNSMSSRLPQWVKATKNRPYLLKIIKRLKLK